MPETERTFTEAEHQAILSDVVAREVAAATQSEAEKVSELQARIDVLEAEKASLTETNETIKAEFETFKTEVEEAKAREARRAERVDRVKAAAQLPDSYFTEERIERWIAMADEAFEALVNDFAEVAIARLTAEQRAEVEKLTGEDRDRKLAEFAGAPRETAAFSGGAPGGTTKVEGDSPAPALRSFMSARFGGGN